MDLKENVKEFFKENKVASVEEISRQFKISKDHAAGIIDELMREGYVEDPPRIEVVVNFPEGFLRKYWEENVR